MAFELKSFFLNVAEDPSDYLALSYVGDSYRVQDVLGGGVEDGYASGRSRLYSTEDDNTVVTFTAANLTASDLAWLKANRGVTLCFRDHLGRKVFCAYHQAEAELSTAPAGSRWATAQTTMPLTLASVTFSEAV